MPLGVKTDRAVLCCRTISFTAKCGHWPCGAIASSGQTLQLATPCISSGAAAGMHCHALRCTCPCARGAAYQSRRRPAALQLWCLVKIAMPCHVHLHAALTKFATARAGGLHLGGAQPMLWPDRASFLA